MARKVSAKPGPNPPPTITAISVEGFKSIVTEQRIDIRPLTLLAGANSSGKSSMMQPLLLLKQTLEAQYDPGPLLLNGPNAKFTSAKQFLPTTRTKQDQSELVIRFLTSEGATYTIGFQIKHNSGYLDLEYNRLTKNNGSHTVTKNSILNFPYVNRFEIIDNKLLAFYTSKGDRLDFNGQTFVDRFTVCLDLSRQIGLDLKTPVFFDESRSVSNFIEKSFHLPGLRGNPERSYPISGTGPNFPGTFENYVAGLLARWSSESNPILDGVGADLARLGLTWAVRAVAVDQTSVEIRVGRMIRTKRGGARDLVNIADVGSGVSQTLPVVVALHAAQPGQLVYIEQPEIHLHPKAQVAMAGLLADAARRGVRVIAETHSSLLLLGVQSLVAEGKLDPDLVKLHWFARDDGGATKITPAELDRAGRFGDWPEDFSDVSMEAENRYIAAAEDQLLKEL